MEEEGYLFQTLTPPNCKTELDRWFFGRLVGANGVQVLGSEPRRRVKGYGVEKHVSGRGILYLDLQKNVLLCEDHVTVI